MIINLRQFRLAIATFLILGQLVWGGGVALAQTTTGNSAQPQPTSTDQTAPPQETLTETGSGDSILVPQGDASSTPQTSDLQSASSTPQLQETYTDQTAIDLNQTHENQDVTIATTTEDVITGAEETATTTDSAEPIKTSEDMLPVEEPQSPPEENIEPWMEEVATPQEYQESNVISTDELIPEPDYVFSINTGKKIPAKRHVKKFQRDRFNRSVLTDVEEEVNNIPNVTADNSTGVVNVSGACEDVYYVVLVYKKQEDYERDRASFIVNRAYHCVGGSFNYAVTELPPTLSNGNYYLLIGSMGEVGSWTPISALTEITLARND